MSAAIAAATAAALPPRPLFGRARQCVLTLARRVAAAPPRSDVPLQPYAPRSVPRWLRPPAAQQAALQGRMSGIRRWRAAVGKTQSWCACVCVGGRVCVWGGESVCVAGGENVCVEAEGTGSWNSNGLASVFVGGFTVSICRFMPLLTRGGGVARGSAESTAPGPSIPPPPPAAARLPKL